MTKPRTYPVLMAGIGLIVGMAALVVALGAKTPQSSHAAPGLTRQAIVPLLAADDAIFLAPAPTQLTPNATGTPTTTPVATSTATVTPTPTATVASTITATSTATSSPTVAPSNTPTATVAASNTPTPTATPTNAPTQTATPAPTPIPLSCLQHSASSDWDLCVLSSLDFGVQGLGQLFVLVVTPLSQSAASLDFQLRAQRPNTFIQWDYSPIVQPAFQGQQIVAFYGGAFGVQAPYPLVVYWVQLLVAGQPVIQVYPNPYGLP